MPANPAGLEARLYGSQDGRRYGGSVKRPVQRFTDDWSSLEGIRLVKFSLARRDYFAWIIALRWRSGAERITRNHYHS